MQDNVIATLVFWNAFVFSAGPFWIATMEAASSTTFKKLYYDYFLYLIVGWLPVLFITSLLSNTIGEMNLVVLTGMHLVGGLYIIFLSIKVLRAKISTGQAFDFNWWSMSLVTYFNPKVWLLLPVGFLTAKITESLPANIAFFYVSGIPIFLFGVFFWGMVGRLGAKISLNYISYFNALLLSGFGGYLIYAGLMLADK